MSQRRSTLHEGLERAMQPLLEESGFPTIQCEGKLLRPHFGYVAGGFGPDRPAPREFWFGALAIQMVHEASLLHDDMLDGADERRGRPALAARKGFAVALLEGDHLLTGAYRAAVRTGSLEFVELFTRAVERTVAGEKRQCRTRGRSLAAGEYQEIIAAKSGELLGAAFALPRLLRPEADGATVEEHVAFGRDVGCVYQRVDDFLDLCPLASLGKAPLQDLAQGKWTWPLEHAGFDRVPDLAPAEVAELLFALREDGRSPMRDAFDELQSEADRLLARRRESFPEAGDVDPIVRGWLDRAATALRNEEVPTAAHPLPVSAPSTQVLESVRAEARALGEDGDWIGYFARHSKSFRFSARLFPREEGRIVSGVYAFCRFTDDLVDRDEDLPLELRRERLAGWTHWVHEAYAGRETGIPLLDDVMGESARRSVSRRHIDELLLGVGMDLEPTRFRNLEELRAYSYRVASVVGLWLTELFGTHTPWVLRRAELMGHAMQLTNILRDVGEDWRRGRLYLPLDRLEAHGIEPEEIGRCVEEGGIPAGWPALIEELIQQAERDYDLAFEAIPELPRFFQRPVAVAGRVYGGIHREIRLNDYDNLRRRAMTSLGRKLMVGGGALWDLRRTRRRSESAANEARNLVSPSETA